MTLSKLLRALSIAILTMAAATGAGLARAERIKDLV